MAEAAAKDTSMEDLRASMRKILNSDSKLDEKPSAQAAARDASGSTIAGNGVTGRAGNPAPETVPGSPQAAREAAAAVAAVKPETHNVAPPARQPEALAGSGAVPEVKPATVAVAPQTPVEPAAASSTAPVSSPASVSSNAALETEEALSVPAAEKSPPSSAAPATPATHRPSLAELARELRLKGNGPAFTAPSHAAEPEPSRPQETAVEAEAPIADESREPALEVELDPGELLGETFLEEIIGEESGPAETAFDVAGLVEAFEAVLRLAGEVGRVAGEPILVEVEPDEALILETEPVLQSVPEATSRHSVEGLEQSGPAGTETAGSAEPAGPAAALVSPVTEAAVNSSLERLKQLSLIHI
jgi:hypothetical protein